MAYTDSLEAHDMFVDRFVHAFRHHGPTTATPGVGRRAGTVRHLLHELAVFADWNAGTCSVGQETIAGRMGVTVETVNAATDAAVAAGWLEVHDVPTARRGDYGRGWRQKRYRLVIPEGVPGRIGDESTAPRKEEREASAEGRRKNREAPEQRPRESRAPSAERPRKSRPRSPKESVRSPKESADVPERVGFNPSVNPSTNPSVNPSSNGTASPEEVERLAMLAVDHLHRGEGRPREADRERIRRWLQEGREPKDVEAAMMGLRFAVDGEHPEFRGWLEPGCTMSTKILDRTDRMGPAVWQVATDTYHRRMEPTPAGREVVRRLMEPGT